MAQRLPALPYRTTFNATWFSGLVARLRLAQAYQGENTEPTKAMIVSPCCPSSLSASTYHQT
jgi:hypothetical protein